MREVDLVLAYLHRNRSVGLTFSPRQSKLEGAADASWEVRHSTSGWVIKWQEAAVSWGSLKQNCTALSSCEAEIIALSEAAKDVVYLRKLVRGLDASAVDGPTELSSDSQSARDSSYNPENHGRLKHVARRHFFIRDQVEAFEIRVPLIGTKDNYADFLTKPLGEDDFFKHRATIMNEPSAAAGGGAM